MPDEGIDAANAPVLLPNKLNSNSEDLYAGHRSHSSHGSHGSHRSSSGGGYSAPKKYTPPSSLPTTPSYPSPSTPSTRPSKPVDLAPTQPLGKTAPSTEVQKPNSADLSVMVVRVQAALMRRGFYNGDIDGLLGPNTRAAIIEFQKSHGLPQTGRMDIETLSGLGIAIP